jgi:hypothetical protein
VLLSTAYPRGIYSFVIFRISVLKCTDFWSRLFRSLHEFPDFLKAQNVRLLQDRQRMFSSSSANAMDVIVEKLYSSPRGENFSAFYESWNIITECTIAFSGPYFKLDYILFSLMITVLCSSMTFRNVLLSCQSLLTCKLHANVKFVGAVPL